MKFLTSKFSSSKGSSDSHLSELPDSRPGRESRWSLSRLSDPTDDEIEAAEEAARDAAKAKARADKHELRKELLRVVLAKTIQKTNVPAAWISGELNSMIEPNGEEWIEVRLLVQVDEPRLLTYLTSFQADFERRMLAAAPDVREWLSGISWKLTPDAIYELPLPHAEYWEQVQADRLLTARQKGAAEWDRESLERHFSDTSPGELGVDFEDTRPPDRDLEDLAPLPMVAKG